MLRASIPRTAFSRANSAQLERTSVTTVAPAARRVDGVFPLAKLAPQASMNVSSEVGGKIFF